MILLLFYFNFYENYLLFYAYSFSVLCILIKIIGPIVEIPIYKHLKSKEEEK